MPTILDWESMKFHLQENFCLYDGHSSFPLLEQNPPTSMRSTSFCSLWWNARNSLTVSFFLPLGPKKKVRRAEPTPLLTLPVVIRSLWRLPILVWFLMMALTYRGNEMIRNSDQNNQTIWSIIMTKKFVLAWNSTQFSITISCIYLQ